MHCLLDSSPSVRLQRQSRSLKVLRCSPSVRLQHRRRSMKVLHCSPSVRLHCQSRSMKVLHRSPSVRWQQPSRAEAPLPGRRDPATTQTKEQGGGGEYKAFAWGGVSNHC